MDEFRRFMVLGWTSEIQLHLPVLMGDEATIGFAAIAGVPADGPRR